MPDKLTSDTGTNRVARANQRWAASFAKLRDVIEKASISTQRARDELRKLRREAEQMKKS